MSINQTISPKTVALIFGVLVISFTTAFYVVAWQEPSQAPTGGNVPAPLNISATSQTKEGDLTINGVLKTLKDMIVNVVTIKGNGSVSTNLNSDKVDDYHAADLLAGGGAGGCAGGLCSTLPVGYYIGFDFDGDGKNAMTGDCDETCKTCYYGSIAWTAAPDGKDQNCNGVIDETQTLTASKSCRHGSIIKTSLEGSCSGYCSSLGLGFKSMTCQSYYGIVNNEDQALDWATCSQSDPQSPTGTICRYGVDTCSCQSIGYQ